ncbi:DUF792 family protein [Borreliella andersonii]|uniref:DUF792 family protein n=1 Tax=Borrelia andersonii TaxID=42109 RepID=UPI003AB125A9
MNLYQTKLFTTFQKEYKNKYGVDISQFVKLTNSLIDFDKFEEKQLTLKQKNVIKSIQKNNEKKIILSGGIASGKTYLACYLYVKSLLTNKKLYSSDTNNFIIGNSMLRFDAHLVKEQLANRMQAQVPFSVYSPTFGLKELAIITSLSFKDTPWIDEVEVSLSMEIVKTFALEKYKG